MDTTPVGAADAIHSLITATEHNVLKTERLYAGASGEDNSKYFLGFVCGVNLMASELMESVDVFLKKEEDA